VVTEFNNTISINFNLTNGIRYSFDFFVDGTSFPQNGKVNCQALAWRINGDDYQKIFNDTEPAILEKVPGSGPFTRTNINAEIFESTVNRNAGQFIFLFKIAR
jgi:hypothetical protein